jgi:hypothetical protein
VNGIEHLVGHRFPGGVRTIAHWENYLLTEATGREPLPDALAHPINLFHVPIDGAGLTIAALFALFEAEGPDRVGLSAYDWEWFVPLREAVEYRCTGEVLEVERRVDDEAGARPYDHVVFRIDLAHDGVLVARATTTWHLWRTPAAQP